ncbi:MAG: ATP synthase subunit I [Defluviitaleaceae bacterium]|nr:ATP synthase subunit I [Defluviitaleaceae bacterium]
MTTISGTAKQLIYGVIAVSATVLLAGLSVIFFIFRFDDPLAFASGLLLGAATASARVVLLEKSIARAAGKGAQAAIAGARLGFLARYALTAGVLAAAALIPGVSLFGTIAGVLSLQPAAYLISRVSHIGSKE